MSLACTLERRPDESFNSRITLIRVMTAIRLRDPPASHCICIVVALRLHVQLEGRKAVRWENDEILAFTIRKCRLIMLNIMTSNKAVQAPLRGP